MEFWGSFGILWPRRAYHVLSDVTCRVPGRIAEILWRSDPNLAIQSVACGESANRDRSMDRAKPPLALPPGDDLCSAPKRKQGSTMQKTTWQPRIRPPERRRGWQRPDRCRAERRPVASGPMVKPATLHPCSGVFVAATLQAACCALPLVYFALRPCGSSVG